VAPPLSVQDRFRRARNAVDGLTAPRLGFRQFFDAFMAELPPDAAAARPSSFLHAVFLSDRALAATSSARTYDPADAEDAAALALSALGDVETMAHAAACAVAAGLFDNPDTAAAKVSATRGAQAARIRKAFGARVFRAQLQNSQLQQLIGPDTTFMDPDKLLPALLLARQRLCRVEVVVSGGGTSKGTGFLIGPSTVLTNWHVVEQAAGPPLVHFDYGQTTGLPIAESSVVRARSVWLVKMSPTGNYRKDDETNWWTDAATRAAWRTARAGELDYAVVHLEGMPGLMRGWYDLAETPTAGARGSCLVLHHPNGQGRTLTHGEFCLHDGFAAAPRLFHTASTAVGSSGGLVLDSAGRPTALHYLGLGPDPWSTTPPPTAPNEVVNVAIPLGAIFNDLASGNGEAIAKVREVEGSVLVRGCLDGVRPVFGRRELLKAIPELKSGARQVLWVQPPAGSYLKPGKSFTLEILGAFFRATEDVFIKIGADRVLPGAKAMAAMILGELSASAAAALPDPATTESAYEETLVSRIRETISNRWPNRRIWLVIDDLDVHELTDDGGRAFLSTLYHQVRTIPQLRIVLLGLRVNLDTIPTETRVVDAISDGDLADPAGLFAQWLQLRGAAARPIPPEVVEVVSAALASHAGAEAPLPAMSDFTVRHLAGPLRKYFGT
jgi:hypothetical protein